MTQTITFNLEHAKDWLGERVSPERLAHSVGAYEKAVELTEKFNLPQEEREKAAIAALLHDAAKLMSPEALLHFCNDRHIGLEPVDRNTPQTLHPFVGAELVREHFNLHDDDILNAIRFHTTGRAGMSRVEKLVYIADKIEGNTRNPLYVQKMTAQLNFRDPGSLDVTMLYILDNTIRFLMDKHQVIHPRTIDARNDFVQLLKQEGRL